MQKATKTLPGINIQYPWSRLIVEGKKVIETRNYPLPKKFVGIEMALIETPGKQGKANGVFEAQVIATIVFSGSFTYKDMTHWIKDREQHQVSPGDPIFGFRNARIKFGWVIDSVNKIAPISAPKKRGIIYARRCRIPIR